MVYKTEVPILRCCDVLVCGAGPAGIAAAVSAARAGLDTVLLERFGVVGGSMTVGNVTTLMGTSTPGAIWQEVMSLLGAPDGRFAIDPEHAKSALLHWIEASSVTLHLLTPIVDAVVNDGILEGVMALTPQGPVMYKARRTIDATGDGYVAYRSGCSYEYGREEDGLVQPVSLCFHIRGVDPTCTLVCRHEEDDTMLSSGLSYLTLCEQAAASGKLPPHVSIVRLYPSAHKQGEYLVNATQVGGVDTLNTEQLTKAEIILRSQMEMVTTFLKEQVPGFSNIEIASSPNSIGIRESRRIVGEYVLTGEDVMEGRSFPDVVVHQASFPIDIHNPTGGGQAEKEGLPHQGQPYDIPLRSLIPLDVEHLILSGRNISGDHRALASYRVMNIAMSIGQASASVAQASLEAGVGVGMVSKEAVQTLLTDLGCTLFK